MQTPLLVYDGDCAFCAYRVRYWERLTGAAVRYEPYQEVVGRYPDISMEDPRQSLQWITPEGERYRGAAAAIRVLAAGGRPAPQFCYRHLPGCAVLAEAWYHFIDRHRAGAGTIARLLWGRERYPVEYHTVSWLFLRVLGLIYLAAFGSFGLQITGLIGSQGILPLQEDLQTLLAEYGYDAWWLFPSVFWLDAGDPMLKAVCLAGLVASMLLVGNILTRLMLPLLFVFYLSLVYAGQVFMSFQWDFLLLEAGFLAIFLPYGSVVIIWLFHWLLFRLRFLSGTAKLLSGDESWAGFTALNYYFETQPLPHAGAWVAHQLPEWLLRAGVGGVFFVELIVPFLVFLPRRPRLFAAWATILMQLLIMLTSNHNFFNLLTIALCLLLFDDRGLQWLRIDRLKAAARSTLPAPGRIASATAAVLAVLIVTSSLSMMWVTFTRGPLPALNEPVVRALVQWHIINNYHVFPTITTQRPEIVMEGSVDGVHWQAYRFRHKPGDPEQLPAVVIPHQPRLDWQMWFAALSPPFTRTSYFMHGFMQRLLEGSPDVLALLEYNPFPEQPPEYVRARLELYRFASPAERSASGNWWVNRPAGMYLPPATLEMLRSVAAPDM
ncbi:MAG: lipase maturation factor family protein [Gammaproteobacteria bacterium]|nr:MAG: lipase maturation factor family protein [Gammaproteobacteria bacterium]